MKKLILLLLFPVILSAQTDKQQALELPDFIITGTRGIDVPILTKKKPRLIPILTGDFFMPVFSPEEFVPAVLSNPYEKELKLQVPQNNFEGKAAVGIGRYTMPTGEFSLIKNFSGLILNLNALGSNVTNYENNSGYNSSLISFGGDYFIKGGGDFLNGTKLSFDARYFRNSYKMFASLIPGDERNGHLFGGKVSLSNNAFKYLSYYFSLDASRFNFNLFDTGETLMKALANLEFKLSGFNLAGTLIYTNENISNTAFASNDYSMLGTDVEIKVKPVTGIQAGAGIYMADYSGSSFMMPKGNLQMILNDNLTLFADFSPEVEHISFSKIISINRYSSFIPVVFQKKKADLKISLRYEYGKYFDITGGAGIAAYDNFLYFEDIITPGIFDPKTTDANRFYSFIKLNFLPGPLGYFYANALFQSMKDGNSMNIPYQPALDASLVYGYDFQNGFSIKAKYEFQTSVYSDLLNTNELSSVHNLGFGIAYQIQNNLKIKLDLENITGNKNYYFKGYLEKPFDIVAGVEYRW